MVLIDQQQEEATNKLPTLKDASQTVARTTNESMAAVSPLIQQQQEITQARLADQESDLRFLEDFAAAESRARQDAGARRAELTESAIQANKKLAAAQNMNPIVRDLRSIIGDITGDDSFSIRKLTNKAQQAQNQLRIFEGSENQRQETARTGLQLFQKQNELEERGFDIRQESIDNQLKISSQLSGLARGVFQTKISELQFGLKQREASRVDRQDTLSRLPLNQLMDLNEQAGASENGFVDAGGVMLSLGDFEQEINKRRSTNLDLEAAELANQSARQDIAQAQYERAVQGLSLDQLNAAVANDFVVESESDAGPMQFQLPAGVVQTEIKRRSELRQQTAGITTELDVEAASAIAELDILQRRTSQVSQRVDSFFGADSGASQEIADELVRGSAGLQALIGPVEDQAKLQEAIETGAIPKERAAAISRQAKKVNAAVESKVTKFAEQAFPDDKVGQESLKAFVTGTDQAPQAAMTTLIKLSLGGTPRGITVDSPMGQAIQAIRTTALTFLQRNLQDPPDLQSLSGDELLGLLVDRQTGKVKPEHEGLIGMVADAAYTQWSGNVTDSMLSQSVEASNSPAFGLLNPSMINAALRNAQAIAEQKVPDATQVNDRAAIEASEFMKQLKSIPANGANAAEVYTQHLNSDAFAGFVDKTSRQLREASFPAYLLDNGAIQGNFQSDLNSLRDLYTRQAGALDQEVMQRRAEVGKYFTDPDQRNIFALRLGGYLAAGADPASVNKYVDRLVQENGGNFDEIWQKINQTKELQQNEEAFRKKILANWGQTGEAVVNIARFFDGLSLNTAFAEDTNAIREAAATEQRELGIFPPSSLAENN